MQNSPHSEEILEKLQKQQSFLVLFFLILEFGHSSSLTYSGVQVQVHTVVHTSLLLFPALQTYSQLLQRAIHVAGSPFCTPICTRSENIDEAIIKLSISALYGLIIVH